MRFQAAAIALVESASSTSTKVARIWRSGSSRMIESGLCVIHQPLATLNVAPDAVVTAVSSSSCLAVGGGSGSVEVAAAAGGGSAGVGAVGGGADAQPATRATPRLTAAADGNKRRMAR